MSLQAVDDDGNAASSAKPQLPSISDERFAAALIKIRAGEYTIEKLKASFTLTPSQNEKLR
jgi:hypothetical protein